MSRERLIAVLAERDARIEALAAQIARRDARLAARDAQVSTLSRQLAELVEANEELAAKLAKLEHLLSRNSANSSIPPSKDDDPGRTPPAAKPARRVGGPKRRRGKQPGAPGANLAWIDNPNQQLGRYPTGRCECGHDLADATDLGVVDRYQQHEIPRMSVTVTQYDQHEVRCGCGRVHTATRPEGARSGPVGYGPLCRIRHNGPYAERPVMPRRGGRAVWRGDVARGARHNAAGRGGGRRGQRSLRKASRASGAW
jgi:transposase